MFLGLALGRTIRKLMGGWGPKYQEKNSRKVKLNEKNSCMPVNPKNIHAMA